MEIICPEEAQSLFLSIAQRSIKYSKHPKKKEQSPPLLWLCTLSTTVRRDPPTFVFELSFHYWLLGLLTSSDHYSRALWSATILESSTWYGLLHGYHHHPIMDDLDGSQWLHFQGQPPSFEEAQERFKKKFVLVILRAKQSYKQGMSIWLQSTLYFTLFSSTLFCFMM